MPNACNSSSNQTYDTCIEASPEIDSDRKDVRTEVGMELQFSTIEPWEQGGGELGIYIQGSRVLGAYMVNSSRLSLRHPGMTCMLSPWLSVRYSVITIRIYA